jgi:hypothetical protein
MTHDHETLAHTLTNGIIGAAASFLGVLTTFQEQLDWALRITGASIGILIGLITLYNLLKKKIK